jgi:NADH-quinone oxidoreductase subunit G
MPTLTIDGMEIEVPTGFTVLQACEAAGAEIPRFCYHPRLAIAGNCRMCLVEMERAPKPIASCAMPAGEGMVIFTNTEKVKQAREGVMEFLLINHPLDCPICDQGGECDLQDQAMAYGRGRNRYDENKRAVVEKDFGPLVKTQMTRCIHCTRCVRFLEDIAGAPELGAFNRGENMEIDTYLEGAIRSELSGNIIDLCPVGALTSKPYAFMARPWELESTESIDVMDAVGSNIRIDTRGAVVMRVLPRLNEAVNEEWISDKTRFAMDGLSRQRLDVPMIRRGGRLEEATWDQAFAAIAERLSPLKGGQIAALAGDLADAESMFALKQLMTALGSPHMDCRQDGAKLDGGCRAGYLFNSTIAGIDTAEACLLIGVNPRIEAPIINARLRKRYLAGGFRLAVIGPETEMTYQAERLGAGPETLTEVLDGTHSFHKVLKQADHGMIILGMAALARPDGAAVLAAARRLAEECGLVSDGWNGFNVLHTAAARVAGLDLGFLPGKRGRDTAGIIAGADSGEIEAVYLLGADEIDMAGLGDAFVIYQGHHGDAGATRADVVLPGAAYTEKNATYVNTEGRVQYGRLASFPPGQAREDWTILRALSEALGKTLKFDTLRELRGRMIKAAPSLAALDRVEAADWGEFGAAGAMQPSPFATAIENFYMTDPISRASATMADCTAARAAADEEATGTDG